MSEPEDAVVSSETPASSGNYSIVMVSKMGQVTVEGPDGDWVDRVARSTWERLLASVGAHGGSVGFAGPAAAGQFELRGEVDQYGLEGPAGP